MSLSKWKIHVYLVSLNMKYRDGWKQTRVNRLSKCTLLDSTISPGKGEPAALPRAGHSARFSISGRCSGAVQST